MRTLVRLRCQGCGYGVSTRAAPARCPMCQGSEWEHDAWRPFSGLLQDRTAGQRGSGESAVAGFVATAAREAPPAQLSRRRRM